MRTIIVNGLALTLVTAIALAKQPAPKPVAQPAPQSSEKPTNLFMSASQINDLIEKAKSERKPNQANVLEPILELGGYDGHLEYRASVGNATVHETEAELFYVIDGSATITTGGKLVDGKRTDAANLNGSAIEGGTKRNIAKGDWILIPQNTPHWFSPINGVLVLYSMHMPGEFTPKH
jgi:mannose-6-phosphate isomerase-like protein (cupin superfamily)